MIRESIDVTDCLKTHKIDIDTLDSIIKSKYPMNLTVMNAVNSLFAIKDVINEYRDVRNYAHEFVQQNLNQDFTKRNLIASIKGLEKVIQTESRFINEEDCTWFYLPTRLYFFKEENDVVSLGIKIKSKKTIINPLLIDGRPFNPRIKVIKKNKTKRIILSYLRDDKVTKDKPLVLDEYKAIIGGKHLVSFEDTIDYQILQYTHELDAFINSAVSARISKLETINRRLRKYMWDRILEFREWYGLNFQEDYTFNRLNLDVKNGDKYFQWFTNDELKLMWSQLCSIMRDDDYNQYKLFWINELLFIGGSLKDGILSIPRMGKIHITSPTTDDFNPLTIRLFFNSVIKCDFRVILTRVFPPKGIERQYGMVKQTTHKRLPDNPVIPTIKLQNRTTAFTNWVNVHYIK